MNFNKLIGYKQTDVAQEAERAIGILVEKLGDVFAEILQAIGHAMQVQEILAHLPPELLDRVGP